jgi:nucleotide-binding universal stress UspA family protein
MTPRDHLKPEDPSERQRTAPVTAGPIVIVVGFDGSPTSLHAGAYAAGLARRMHARLVVVHVQETPRLSLLAPEHAWFTEEAQASVSDDLRRQVAEGSAYAGVPVEFVAVRGDPLAELCRIATDVRADAVVIGASTRIEHRLVGSLAVRLVRIGRWPVTVVP